MQKLMKLFLALVLTTSFNLSLNKNSSFAELNEENTTSEEVTSTEEVEVSEEATSNEEVVVSEEVVSGEEVTQLTTVSAGCTTPTVVTTEAEFFAAYQDVVSGNGECLELGADIVVSSTTIDDIDRLKFPGDFSLDGKGHTMKFEFVPGEGRSIFRPKADNVAKVINIKDLIVEASGLSPFAASYNDTSEFIYCDLWYSTVATEINIKGVHFKTPEAGLWNDLITFDSRKDAGETTIINFLPGDIITDNIVEENVYNSSVVWGAMEINFDTAPMTIGATAGDKLGAPFVSQFDYRHMVDVEIKNGAEVNITSKNQSSSMWLFQGARTINIMDNSSLIATNGESNKTMQIASPEGLTINVGNNATLDLEHTSQPLFNDYDFYTNSRKPIVINGNAGSSVYLQGGDAVFVSGHDDSKINLTSPTDYEIVSTTDNPILVGPVSDISRLNIQSNVAIWLDPTTISPEFEKAFTESDFQAGINDINEATLSDELKGYLAGDYDFSQYRAVRYAQNPLVSGTEKTIFVDDTINLDAEITPWLTDSTLDVTYTAADGTILSVDADGNITGLSEGETLVTVKVYETGKYKLMNETTIKVIVKKKPTPAKPTVPGFEIPNTGVVQ